MPVDQALNARIRDALATCAGISEKQMMGGQCFFLNGNMLCGARLHKDGVGRFMFRVGKANESLALQDVSAQPVIHGGRKLGGFVTVNAAECDGPSLDRWLELCLGHAAALPAKS
ncbi:MULTISPECIES: TfoX/Sxy family protein [unclassified Ruegeria]|uniref:TfoX/Sxy family protein n=1 Tax=unclassified Ruegeria TaxID=2625375 RepID=UPI001489FFA3|nr:MULTISPECIES: TfoX/Sxy family protein [unclassified Ruegeria]